MKVSVMQPYFMPYIGYFQLIKEADFFVFYDDVNFINRGWINRNRILVNQKPTYITISLENASQNKLINEIIIFERDKTYDKILKTIEQSYKKAPYFRDIFELIKNIFAKNHTDISSLAAESVMQICDYLDLKTQFSFSSKTFLETKDNNRADRLIEITRQLGGNTLINAIGGQALYEKTYFKEHGIDLFFIKTKDIQYTQKTPEFQPNLSIIDVLMNNSKEETQTLISKYELI